MSKHNNNQNPSVDLCQHCRKRRISIGASNAGFTKCPECIHLELNRVYTIQDYNNYLKRNQ